MYKELIFCFVQVAVKGASCEISIVLNDALCYGVKWDIRHYFSLDENADFQHWTKINLDKTVEAVTYQSSFRQAAKEKYYYY